jgi:hypothetical protein
MKPTPKKPRIIITHDEGSGTAIWTVAASNRGVMPREYCVRAVAHFNTAAAFPFDWVGL